MKDWGEKKKKRSGVGLLPVFHETHWACIRHPIIRGTELNEQQNPALSALSTSAAGFVSPCSAPECWSCKCNRKLQSKVSV